MKKVNEIQERYLQMKNNYELSYEKLLDLTNEISPYQPLRKTQLNTGNKSFYTQVEYGRIRGYTVHTRIREYRDTHSVSV